MLRWQLTPFRVEIPIRVSSQQKRMGRWREGFGTNSGVKRCRSRDTRDHACQPQEQLQRRSGKFGDEHKLELYRIELRCWAQKANESLQAFGIAVERFEQLTYPG